MKATLTGIEKRMKVLPNKTEGILNYDVDNAYPQRTIDITNASGTASTCLQTYIKFIMGGGASDPEFYKQKINDKGLTVDKFIRKISASLGRFTGIAIHYNYNALFEKTEVNYVPFQYCRMTTEDSEHPNMIAIYDDWDKSKCKTIKKDKIKYVHYYNPSPEVIMEQVEEVGGWENYKGQILYWTPEYKEYPLASYDSVLEDMQTDSKAKIFKFRNITTNFIASHLLVTNKMENDEAREEFGQTILDFEGADNACKIMHIERDSNEDAIDLKKVEIQDVEKLYEHTENSVRDNIIRKFLIPHVLLVSEPGKLGTATEIENAIAWYNGITADERLLIEEILKESFTNFATPINISGDYSLIPYKSPVSETKIAPEYFPYVTKNQILESIGLPAVEEVNADRKPLYEALGVGGLQSLASILADVNLTREQKIASLEIIFKLTTEEANRLAGEVAQNDN